MDGEDFVGRKTLATFQLLSDTVALLMLDVVALVWRLYHCVAKKGADVREVPAPRNREEKEF